MSRPHIHPAGLLEHSGFTPPGKAIPVVKRHQYEVCTAFEVAGDAPKDFVRVYEHGHCRKANRRNWPLYIAKVGHKHYPMESVTEHLLNRLGEVLGMHMASSRLVKLGGQVRFMSKYFLDEPAVQELVHGANIYAGFLNNDHALVEAIEKEGSSPLLFTVQFTHEALRYTFPVHADALLEQFMRMLVFDAYVGNNDRHFYNWGVIRNITEREYPRFSPIYDTARGLFWNDHEDKLAARLQHEKQIPAFIGKYCEGSKPKIGWEGKKGVNHFELIAEMKRMMPATMLDAMRGLVSPARAEEVRSVLKHEFQALVSHGRARLILLCLEYRRARLASILQ